MGEIIKMPECHQCKFFKPINLHSGECTNFRIILGPHGDAALCPIRRFVPNPVDMYTGPASQVGRGNY
jgi:hypothetical protein